MDLANGKSALRNHTIGPGKLGNENCTDGLKAAPEGCSDLHNRLALLIFSRKLSPFCEGSHLNPSS